MQYDMTDPARRAGNAETHDNNPAHELRHASLHSSAPEVTLDNGVEAPASEAHRTSTLPQAHFSHPMDADGLNRSSTPPDASGTGSVKYTRTGRISKAAKGQRIHHCDECGKTYTRAEHLRRHQQNHKPGAFPCDVEGCGRSFYREDLLTRHKIRHNDPLDPPSRRHSEASQSPHSNSEGGSATAPAPAPAPILGFPAAPTSYSTTASPHMQTQSGPSDNNAQQASTSPRPPKRLPVPPNELLVGAIPIEIGGLPALYGLGGRRPREPPFGHEHAYDYDYDSDDAARDSPYGAQNLPRLRYANTNDARYELPSIRPLLWSSSCATSQASHRPHLRNFAYCNRPRCCENLLRTRLRVSSVELRNQISKERERLSERGYDSRKHDLEAEIAEAAFEQSCLLAYWNQAENAGDDKECSI